MYSLRIFQYYCNTMYRLCSVLLVEKYSIKRLEKNRIMPIRSTIRRCKMANSNITNAGSANKAQVSQALVIQGYANSVLEQPTVSFPADEKNLVPFQTGINNKLALAQKHAKYYLETLQPSIIGNMSDIGNYFQLHNALPSVLPVGSTPEQWIESLTAVKIEAQKYEKNAKNLVADITNFHNDLTTDAADFVQIVKDLNDIVGGDNGILVALEKNVSSIQSDIDGAIAGIVASSLAVVGGTFMICVGAIADFVTAGTSTPVVLGGIAIVAGGVGGDIGAGVALAGLYDQEAKLLQEETSLRSEVTLASSIRQSYSALEDKVKKSIDAASNMANAWNFLISDIDNIILDLENGIGATSDTIREIFIVAANGEIAAVLTDIDTIKNQMAGVEVKVATAGQTVSDLIHSAIKDKKAA